MKMNRTSTLGFAALLAIAGCSEDAEDATPSSSTSTGQRIIDEGDVENYFAAMKKIRQNGSAMEEATGNDPSSFQKFAQGMQFQGEWEEALDDHDLDPASFMQIHSSLAMAFGKAMMEEQVAKMADQQAEAYEKMKASMGEEAAKNLMDAQRGAAGMFDGAFGEVPEENVELVKKMKVRLQELWGAK